MRAVPCLALLGLLLPATSSGATRNEAAEALASQAEEALGQDCAQVLSDDYEVARQARKQVRTVYEGLSDALKDTRKVYLLYWRGVLAQCLQDPEQALDDLKAFLSARGESTTWASLIEDAELRVARLRRRLRRRSPPDPGSAVPVVAAIALGGASGVFAGLSGRQWSLAQAQAEVLYVGGHIGPDSAEIINHGEDLANRSRGFFALSAGSAVGAAAIAVIGAARSGRAVALAPYVSPTQGGAVLGIGGAW